jgi:riboflavin synthase
MFTGIVEECGTVVAISEGDDAAIIEIGAATVLDDASPGDSIAVNGVCLTVVDLRSASFTADVMRETLVRSSLGALQPGSPVNLERAARLDSRLGGHLVQGHVDGTGEILAIEPSTSWTVMRISLPASLGRYVVEKGSITVDGVSLTVVSVDDDAFTVSLIPVTLSHTTLGRRVVGDLVNLEVDAIAKYVERLMVGRTP